VVDSGDEKMKNSLIVKVLAVLIANLFLMASFVSVNANPKVDQSALDSAQTHDTFQFSYYENQKSESDFLSPDRNVDLTIYNAHNPNQTVPDINVTVYWETGEGTWFGGNVLTGIIVGAIVVGLIVGLFTFGLGFAVAQLVQATITLPMLNIIGAGAIAGAIGGGVSAWRNSNIGGTVENLRSDAEGKCHTSHSWQDGVSIVVDLDIETEISGYAGFKPSGQPQWYPKHVDENKQTQNRMSCDIMLVTAGGMGSLLGNMQIAQGKVGNLTYVETDDDSHYTDNANFEIIDMHKESNAESYAETLSHAEWADKDFWRSRISVYPDGKGSDILWVESRRLIHINDATGVASLSVNATYENGNGVVIHQGAPAGAIILDEPSHNLVPLDEYATGKYIYYQWVWVVGLADLTHPTITVKASLLSNLGLIDAGWETIAIPEESHIITFTFSDSSLIGSVHHTVYADRSIPTVHASLEFNLYGIANKVRVKSIGIQTIPEKWNTGYGLVTLTQKNCAYNMYFAVEDNSGDVVQSTTPASASFDFDKATGIIKDMSLVNISNEQSYRLTLNNAYFDTGSKDCVMSSTLFYQLTDWDNHYNLTVELEKLLNKTFTLTGSGNYGNFNTANVNSIQSYIEEMNGKIQIHEQRLKTFIQDNGESNYTKKCADMIMKFKFFYKEFLPYKSMLASDIGSNAKDFGKFRALSYALLYTFNHAYLYYSCSVAYLHGDTELASDLDTMMAYENALIDEYYNALGGNNFWDLTLLVMILISVIVGLIVAYGVYRYQMTRFHKPDDKKIAIFTGVAFCGATGITFAVLWFVFQQAIYNFAGNVPKMW
jgi:hypothetical protein